MAEEGTTLARAMVTGFKVNMTHRGALGINTQEHATKESEIANGL